jgi:cytochrome c peroxidase
LGTGLATGWAALLLSAAVSLAAAAEPVAGGFGPLPPVSVPADNPMSAAKVELGRLLFWDTRLSGNASTSCASCHAPQTGWGEPEALSRGYPGTRHWRNAQTILNAAYYSRLFWDGAADSLEKQAQSAAEGAVAGNGDAAMMEMRLRLVPEYVIRFRQVFGTEWPRVHHAWQAIAAFQRTLVSDPKKVPFDRWLAGDAGALSAAAQRGYALFIGKAGCLQCHGGPLLSDQAFHALGVPRNSQSDSNSLVQITARWQNLQRGVSETQYKGSDADLGLAYLTRNPADAGRFRTPSLRELRYTAPYMHNGVFATLRDVVDFFDKGGGEGANKAPQLRPLGLGATEKQDLVAFLESLSMDQPLLLAPPQVPKSMPLADGGMNARPR